MSLPGNNAATGRGATFTQQHKLSDYCRTGKYRPIKGITPGRIHHYRHLVYNVIEDALQSAYPLTRQLLVDAEWGKMVDEFIRLHGCQSMQVWKMPSELYAYMKDHPHPIKEKYPQLIDLLYFEWEEVDLFMMEDRTPSPFSTEGDLLRDPLVLNPEYRILRLEYPVHLKLARDITSFDKGDYYVLLFRDGNSGKVNFLELSAFYTWLIEYLYKGFAVQELAVNGGQLFHITAPEILDNTHYFLEELRKQEFILGFKK